MTPGIKLTKIWEDEDLVKFGIEVSDSSSLIVTNVYFDHSSLSDEISHLEAFNGGILDFNMGRFGPEYAGGAFHACLNFLEPYRILVTARLQYDFQEFGSREVASEGTLYFKTAPLLLNCFINELRELAAKRTNSAYLQAAYSSHQGS